MGIQRHAVTVAFIMASEFPFLSFALIGTLLFQAQFDYSGLIVASTFLNRSLMDHYRKGKTSPLHLL